MTTQATIYRCSFLSVATAAPLATVQWTQQLAPIGNAVVESGELVEILVRVDDASHPIGVDTALSFEIVTTDFALSGAAEDRVASFRTTSETAPARSTERVTAIRPLGAEGSLPAVVASFQQEHVADFQNYVLIVPDEAGSTVSTVAWWFVTLPAGESASSLLVTVDIEALGRVTSDASLSASVRAVEPSPLVPANSAEPDPDASSITVRLDFPAPQADLSRFFVLARGTTKSGSEVSFTIDENIDGAFTRSNVPPGEYTLVLLKK